RLTMIITEKLPFIIFANKQELQRYKEHYDIDIKRYFDEAGECRIELSAYADLSTGEMLIGSDQIFTELLNHESRRGTRLMIIDGKPTRYTSELGELHPSATRVRSFIPTSMLPMLSDDELALLSREIKIRNPKTCKMVSVFDISAMDIICTVNDCALRMNKLTNKKQIETAILLQKLKQQLTREAIALKFRAIYEPENLSAQDEVSLYSKPRTVIRPKKLFNEQVYQTFAWLRDRDHDESDPTRYKRNAVVMNDIRKIGYGFLSKTAQSHIRSKKMASNVRFGNCLNAEGLRQVSFNLAKAAQTARLYFERGEHDKFMTELAAIDEDFNHNVLIDSDC
ncbi:TPA: hypothetical protein ACGTR7_002549, partial [Vibrio parahaemolyticus]